MANENDFHATPSQGKLVKRFSLNPSIMKERFSALFAFD